MSMIIKPPQTKPCPVGTHHAVLKDVEDLGEVETQYGTKEKVLLEWEVTVDEEIFTVKRRYNRTLHPKADLNKDLTSWIGRDPAREAPDGFDLETMIGKASTLVIGHTEDNNGQAWAQVQAVLPSETPSAAGGDPAVSSEEDLPF